jgi:sensor histidine kinase regulating citrate/malate metabolism
MLCDDLQRDLVGQSADSLGDEILSRTVKHGNQERNVNLAKANIILDRVPIKEDGGIVGTVAILHNRAEYTKLMEELSGTRYLVDSMRANNHDFTNKLHVILGLIQMEMYDDASSYIQNITMVQRENISKVMNAVGEPAVAALLIGKIARASEVNVNFVLREGCHYSPADMNLPSEMLITVIGNLLDNAFDAMNGCTDYKEHKELLFGIYSKPEAVLITVDDTGSGIRAEDMKFIFDNGYSSKSEGRGTGLYQVKSMVENFGGKITVFDGKTRTEVEYPITFKYTENSRLLGLADFAAAMESGRPGRATHRQTYHVLEVMTGIMKSAETGVPYEMTTRFQREAPMDPSLPHGEL